MTKIINIHAREVLDSRGNPTVEVEVECSHGVRGRAIVPSGASTGRHEAVELRDGDRSRYGGMGVQKAVAHVRDTIAPAIQENDVRDQAVIDRFLVDLDGTSNKSRLGANAILGVSLACAHAAAAVAEQPLYEYLAGLWSALPAASEDMRSNRSRMALPLPMVNMISGGLHAGGNLDFQDFLIVPHGAATYREALEWTWKIYRSLGSLLAERRFESALVGDEGGYGPHLSSSDEAVELLCEAIERAGLARGTEVGVALDLASSHFYAHGRYELAHARRSCSAAEMVDFLAQWTDRYPIVSIEDGCAEDDWDGWKLLSEKLAHRVQLVGDDLFATNAARLRQGIECKIANAILIKFNQVGTLTETLQVIDQARGAGYAAVISARSGETEDVTMAHLAVATGCGQIKIGSIARSERLAKYNELLRIEEALGSNVPFANRSITAKWRR